MQLLWAKSGFTLICDFAATASLSDEAESLIRKQHPELLDQQNGPDQWQFFGRTDGKPVAPHG